MTVREEKAALRKALLALRSEAAAADEARAPFRRSASIEVARHFPEPPPPASVIASYVPMRGEMNPDVLIGDLQGLSIGFDLGHVFVLPRTPPKGSGAPLSFHVTVPEAEMERSAFGVLEPPLSSPAIDPDLLFVPLLGFDRTGARLGYGAGHYDRTLAMLRARKRIIAVGIAWACQEVARLPVDDTDQPLDFILTEREFIAAARG